MQIDYPALKESVTMREVLDLLEFQEVTDKDGQLQRFKAVNFYDLAIDKETSHANPSTV